MLENEKNKILNLFNKEKLNSSSTIRKLKEKN